MPNRAVWRKDSQRRITWIGYLRDDQRQRIIEPLENLGCLFALGALVFVSLGNFPVAAICVLIFGLPSLLKRLPSTDVTPLLTLPLPAPAHPCGIEVSMGGQPLGLDRGVVTFIDGWLHFEGYRCGFSLSRNDARQRDNHSIFLQEGGEVRFFPDTRTRFDESLDAWYRLGKAAQGLSLLPPETLHDSGRFRAKTDFFITLIKAVILYVAGYYWIFFAWDFWFGILTCAGGTYFLVLAVGQSRFLRKILARERSATNPPLGRRNERGGRL